MPFTTTNIATLHAEAARCERIAHGLSNPELVDRLLAWASDYRRDAALLAGAEVRAGATRPRPRPVTRARWSNNYPF